MAWVLAVPAVVLLAWVALQLAIRFWPESHWRPALVDLEGRYGIEIELADIDFPGWFRAQRGRYRLTLPFERTGVIERLALDLSRYPPHFVEAHLDGIVVLRSFELNGKAYGGTYDASARRIYIDAGWLGDDGSGDEAMGLHHEFSSVLMKRHPDVFRREDWAALNPPGFEYRFRSSGVQNLTAGDVDLIGNADLFSAGFLCGYGRATLEDDINTFAQYLVADKARWAGLSREYAVLAEKMALLERWYRALGFAAPSGADRG